MGGAWALIVAVLGLAAAPAEDVAESGAPTIEPASERITSEVLYAVADRPVTLFHYFSVAPDCAAAPAQLTVVEPPAHGQVSFAEGLEPPAAGARPLWTAPDPRARCLTRLLVTRDAIYAPDPGFAGHDRLAIQFRDSSGSFTDVIEVNVVHLGMPARASRKPADKRRSAGR